MEKHIREAYNDRILTEALERYGLAKQDTHLLDGFESFIYEYEKGSQGYILRIYGIAKAHSYGIASG